MVTIKPLIKCDACNGQSVIHDGRRYNICQKCKGAGHVPVLEIYSKFYKRSNHEDISKLAYFKWLEAGKPEGRNEQFWLEAEKELRDHKQC